MTQLRQQMIRAMELKNLSKHTQRAYLAAVTGLARLYRQSPDEVSQEMVDDYLLFLKNDKGSAPNSRIVTLSGLRFFFNNVVRKEVTFDYRIGKKPRKLPTVLWLKSHRLKIHHWRFHVSCKNILQTTSGNILYGLSIEKLFPTL